MSEMTEYQEWFKRTTGFDPHQWQAALGSSSEARSRLIRIPTGFGKTQGVVGAWAFHRLVKNDPSWPRRLVFCLPMRVLVEQTADVIRDLLERMGVLAPVHVLMGGSEASEWHLEPESPAVLIGTQDMLLSRALNRGYAAARGRWPMEYGLLSNDALWVMDEVQLMDVGLVTSVQTQAFRDSHEQQFGGRTFTWWMSATLQARWLQTTDSEGVLPELEANRLSIPSDQRRGSLFDIRKPVSTLSIPASEDKGCKKLSDAVLDAHVGSEAGQYGRVTLVVVNTVRTAVELHAQLAKNKSLTESDTDLRLVHSRFRGEERKNWRSQFLQREACAEGTDRIIVATQVVEAGVDISATAMVTELAPWPSLVQRFGRAARYGGTANVVVVDRNLSSKQCLPYDEATLSMALQAVGRLTDVGILSLENFEDDLRDSEPEFLSELYPYEPLHILRHEELSDLFDTDPDLTGSDVDVSRFIRTGEERDLSVWWWKFPSDSTDPEPSLQPMRDALCAVPVPVAREWLCEKSGRLKEKVRAWSWSYLEGQWIRLHASDMRPGQVVLVDTKIGGYSLETGFTGTPSKKGEHIPTEGLDRAPSQAQFADLAQDHEDLSSYPYKTIATHGGETGEAAARLAAQLSLDERTSYLLALAGRWHDLGKSHPVFQAAMRQEHRDAAQRGRTDLAKAPSQVWARGRGMFGQRRGFRHELVSTLALFEGLRAVAPAHAALLGPYQQLIELGVLSPDETRTSAPPESQLLPEIAQLSAVEFNLVAYLVCAHHGKVRCSWQSTPHDQEYITKHSATGAAPIRGVHEGDEVPATPLTGQDGSVEALPSFRLSLEGASLGLSSRYGESWQERVLGLRQRLGDPQLAYLETLLRVADIRASRLQTNDPLLTEGRAL